MKRFLLIFLSLALAGSLLMSYLLEKTNVPPRLLGLYIEQRVAGHNPLLLGMGEWLGRSLIALDRGDPSEPSWNLNGWLATASAPVYSGGHDVLVASSAQAVEAISQARPGEVITLLPGHYRFYGKNIPVSQPGTSTARITVRALRPGTVFLELDMLEGFLVSAPYWTFENLDIRGVCASHSACEHAFHIVAKASGFIARNNHIADFNAHFKINGIGADMPDDGLLEGNALANSTPRQTENPVTLIDLVAANRWLIRRNLLSDFVKGAGDRISYGAYAKGAGAGNRFEQNIVLCEQHLRGSPGQRVGLSLGGGGTGVEYCRDHRCITEQDGGVIQANLIANCSDDGIYLNRAATSRILHNTLLDTGGIVVRYAESSADVQGNLVDGNIRSRDGGVLRAADNIETNMTELYLGRHPVRDMYVNAGALDLRWRDGPPHRNVVQDGLQDLCGVQWHEQPAYGAFEDFSACLVKR